MVELSLRVVELSLSVVELFPIVVEVSLLVVKCKEMEMKSTSWACQKAFGRFFYGDLVSGEHQFAYKPGRGARDALALLVLTWISGFDKGDKFAVYHSATSCTL